MGNKIKIGVLGCASIAQRSVIPAIQSLNNYFELVAVASRSLDKSQEFAKEFNCEAFHGYDDLVHSEQIEALYIPLPTGLHKEWINMALRSGKHVYAEKSIAMCHSDACEMVSNARVCSMALMEGFMFQYHRQHQIVLDLLKKNVIGDVRHFYSSFGFPPISEENFRYDKTLGGGALFDAAGYPLRAVHFILGDSLKVTGSVLHKHPRKNIDIYGSAFLSNTDGIGATIAFGFDNFYQCRYEIWGQKGKITAERAFTPRFDFSPKIIIETENGARVIQVEPDNHFVRAFEEFYRIICNPKEREKHYEDILLQSHSLEIINNHNSLH